MTKPLWLVLLLCWLTTTSSLADTPSTALNERLRLHASRAPTTVDIVRLVGYLKTAAQGEQEKAEVMFYWIALNIRYDLALKKRIEEHDSTVDVSVVAVLKTHQTVCAGYASLYQAMVKLAGLECKVISGDVYNFAARSAPHAWNAVQINGRWRLVDPTWGSGGFSYGSDTYESKLDTRYLFADPCFLLISHFPQDPKWQLLPTPMSLQEFLAPDWQNMRLRKFNDLLDDAAYQESLEADRDTTIFYDGEEDCEE